MVVEVVMPALGLTVEKGKILQWLKKEGDHVLIGESLFEVETDKVTTEVESPASGILRKILVPVEVEVPILTVVAVITEEKEVLPEKYLSMGIEKPQEKEEPAPQRVEKTLIPLTAGLTEIKAPPAARRFAKEKGIDLSLVKGSGPGGTILLKDVKSSVETGASAGPKILATPTARKLAERESIPLTAIKGTGFSGRVMKADVIEAMGGLKSNKVGPVTIATKPLSGSKYQLGQIIVMNSMRRVIAKRMVQSKYTAPHIYFFNDVEMDKLVALRQEVIHDFEQNDGVRISMNDFFIKTVALTLREHPIVNSMVSGEEIHIFPEINIGLAVAMEDGLIVPAIPKADQLSLSEIAHYRMDLVERAHRAKLTIEEVKRGTFTISSLAQFDITFFTAILNPPQSGILTLGKMEEKPVIKDEHVVIRKIIRQGLSVDHRIVDGAVAASFLHSLKKKLENPCYTFLNR